MARAGGGGPSNRRSFCIAGWYEGRYPLASCAQGIFFGRRSLKAVSRKAQGNQWSRLRAFIGLILSWSVVFLNSSFLPVQMPMLKHELSREFLAFSPSQSAGADSVCNPVDGMGAN